MTYQFGDFRLDPAERLLTRTGQPVALTPKAFDLLVYLVEHQGRLVEKSTLMAALWPDTIVEEANLAFQVSALRKALGDGGNGESMIQTVPTRGYRFVADVTSRKSDASAVDASGPPAAPTTPPSAPPRLFRPVVVGALALLAVALAGGALLMWRNSGRVPGTVATAQVPVRLVMVTTLTGWQDWPSLSPDGDQVVFEWGGEQNENHDIYVTIVGSRDVRRLTTDPAPDFAPAWSPNGREIAFLRAGSGISSQIRLMSALGGPDRSLSDFPAWASIAWSPDARFIAAGRLADNDPDRGLYLVPVSGGPPRAIVPVRAPSQALAPAFSPDGHRLAYAICDRIDQEGNAEAAENTAQGCHVMLVDLDETYATRGTPRRLTTRALGGVGALAWSRDGRTVVFSGHVPQPPGDRLEEVDQYLDHLWRVSAGDSAGPEVIELAGLNARRATTSGSRDRLVFQRGQDDWDVYRLTPGGTPERYASSAAMDGHPQFSTDGRRVTFASDRTGNMEIWVANVDGTSQRQLTRGPTAYQGSPRWSPDDSTIAFDAQEANGDRHIWTIPVEGGGARQLTTMRGEQSAPTWSHDGQWIYFSSGDRRHLDIWRVPTAGGRPEKISSTGSGVIGFESADRQHIVYKLRTEDSPLVEAPLSGGGHETLIACVGSSWGFSVHGASIYYLPCGTAATGAVRVLNRTTGRDAVWAVVPDSASAFLWDVPVSPDGRTLLYNRNVSSRANLWMLENFK